MRSFRGFMLDVDLMGWKWSIIRYLEELLIIPPQRLYKKLCRMAYWAWVMRDNEEWDFVYFYRMVYYKLDRMDRELLKCPEEDKFCLWQTQDKAKVYRSLIAAKEAARRLGFESPHYRFSSEFYEHYGFGNERFNFYKPIPKYHVSPETYRKIQKDIWNKDEKYYQHTKDLLFKNLDKWGDHWWT